MSRLLFCFQGRLDRGLYTLIRVIRDALAVDVECRRAVNAQLSTVYDVALNLLSELAAVERCIEASTIETKLTRILSQLVRAQRGLVAKEYASVFPVLTLLARCFGCFGSFARVRVL